MRYAIEWNREIVVQLVDQIAVSWQSMPLRFFLFFYFFLSSFNQELSNSPAYCRQGTAALAVGEDGGDNCPDGHNI